VYIVINYSEVIE